MQIASAKRYLSNLSDINTGTCFSQPSYVDLIITKKCNLKCSHCDSWKNGNLSGMTHEQWLKVITNISSIGGKQVIEISGGEPLIEKDLSLKIANLGSRLGLFMALNTNGALINEQMAEDILSSGLGSVKISLYSLDENIHDKLRGMPGACAKAKEALICLKEKKGGKDIKIEVGMLLTGSNISGINDLVSCCQENNFYLIIQPLDFCLERNYEENWQATSGLWPTKEQVKKYLKPLIENKPRVIKNPPFYLRLIYNYYLNPNSLDKRRCLSPYNNLIVWPSGDVSLCFRGNIIGSVLKDSLKNIWYGRQAKKERNSLKFCQKSCKIIGCNMRKQLKDLVL